MSKRKLERESPAEFPFLTIYEKAEIIGTRVKDLQRGEPPRISSYEGMEDYDIAMKELEMGLLDYLIQRPNEIVRISQLRDPYGIPPWRSS